jgi:hypothetical protein
MIPIAFENIIKVLWFAPPLRGAILQIVSTGSPCPRSDSTTSVTYFRRFTLPGDVISKAKEVMHVES